MSSQPLAEQVLQMARELPEGTPLSAKELLHLGSRAAVDQALSRLVKRGSLLRVGRGLYVAPVVGKFGARSPSTVAVVEAAAVRRGEAVARHGAMAANALGLTTQVPVREVFLTSGPSRRMHVGGLVVELRHAPAWQLLLPNRSGGDVIRAMAWLGRERAGEALSQAERQLAPAELAEMASVRGQLPEWVAREVSGLVAHG
jgi:hypothetical protein